MLVCEHVQEYTMPCIWRSEDNVCKSLLFYCLGTENSICAIRLGSRYLCPLSCLVTHRGNVLSLNLQLPGVCSVLLASQGRQFDSLLNRDIQNTFCCTRGNCIWETFNEVISAGISPGHAAHSS